MSNLVEKHVTRGQIEYYTAERWNLMYPDIYNSKPPMHWTQLASDLLDKTIQTELGASSIKKMPDTVWIIIADAYWGNVTNAGSVPKSGHPSDYYSLYPTELDRRLEEMRSHVLEKLMSLQDTPPAESSSGWHVHGPHPVMDTKPPPPPREYPAWDDTNTR
jgi:hypothetical protein